MYKNPLFLMLLVLISLSFYEWSTIYNTSAATEELAIQTALQNDVPLPTNPFSQDGCTLFPNTVLWHDLRPACLQHDIAYWAGGLPSDKAAADVILYSTVRQTGWLGPILARVMYWGVTNFGDSKLTTQMGANWGYGNNPQ